MYIFKFYTTCTIRFFLVLRINLPPIMLDYIYIYICFINFFFGLISRFRENTIFLKYRTIIATLKM